MSAVGRFLWMVVSGVLWAGTAYGGPCSNFPWHIPQDMMIPDMIQNGQTAMQAGQLSEAQEWFSTYLNQHNEGVFAEGTRWVTASLPDPSDEPGKEFLQRVDRLQAMKTSAPESVYAPWALCAIGEIYWEAGWDAEANGIFEAFLQSYPDHPLAGGVMVEAGLGYLKNKQYLEAALVLRRVVEEPKWNPHRVRGALGLADATAMAKAWRQAYYWYRVVEAESPELLRQSEDSAYYFGLSELAAGNPANALSKFLLAINLHPRRETAGLAFNRISEQLLQDGHDFLSLWFADQARQRFPDQAPARRGIAALTRWLLAFLSQEPVKATWDYAYQRLNELDLYISLSWDQVLEFAGALRQAPESELAEDSLLWMGQAYQALNDIPSAIQAWSRFIVMAGSDERRRIGQDRLSYLLNRHIRDAYARKAWISLLKFHEEHQYTLPLIPLERERVFMVAHAYQQVNLPAEALHWYDRLRKEYPEHSLRQDILVQQVLLAEEQGNHQLVREAGISYLQGFPEGRWRGQVEMALGTVSLDNQEYAAAVTHFSGAIAHIDDVRERRHVLRSRARAYRALGQMEQAIEDLKQVVLISPGQVPDLIRLGDSLFDHGEYTEAARHYDRVRASEAPGPLQAWAKYRLAVSLDLMGQKAEAKTLFNEIRQAETRAPDLEHTIRSAATAVLNDLSLNEKLPRTTANEQIES